MTRFILISFLIAMACVANGQGVVVNPDGTHSVLLTTGNHSIAVSADGRHTVLIGCVFPGSPRIEMHPEIKHSVIHSHGAHTILIGSNGTHRVLVNQPVSLSPVDSLVRTQELYSAAVHRQLAMLLMLLPLMH